MKKISIIGAGASGMAAAIYLKSKREDLDITIFEADERVGRKILKTGSGKCNISNNLIRAEGFNNSDFINKLLKKVSIVEVYQFIEEELGIMLKSDFEGRLYPFSESSKSVVDSFKRRLDELNIKIIYNSFIETYNENYISIFACGSKAQSKFDGYQLVKNLGHTIKELKPGLVPIAIKEKIPHLRGIRVKCSAKIIVGNDILHEDSGEILFKDDALSGILAMDLSRFYCENCFVSLDLVKEKSLNELYAYFNKHKNKGRSVEEILLGMFPKMLVMEILKRGEDVVKTCKNLIFNAVGLNSYNQAQITVGGVNINEINECCKSLINENVYIVGEMLDIDGKCGGYNLSFAFLSAIAAGKDIINKLN
ncbi:MAG: aminoacetone oxidase family FAD-binding enzyme [Bacilli bacterium]|jgi:hypothetical protein|nr:aminoacetone oxidase family FAD-binding enzyme [Bacilli bacterium]